MVAEMRISRVALQCRTLGRGVAMREELVIVGKVGRDDGFSRSDEWDELYYYRCACGV